MDSNLKTYAKSVARHLRLLILIDEHISEKQLRNILNANLVLWGGRYNPIIPIKNGKIDNDYDMLIQHFDPDYIYYPINFDVAQLERFDNLHPKSYESYRLDQGYFDFVGMETFHLLDERIIDADFYRQGILFHAGPHDMKIANDEFYKMNFGLQYEPIGTRDWDRAFQTINITPENLPWINRTIFERYPYFKTRLSTICLRTIRLGTDVEWSMDRFEWILYDKTNSVRDLLYFWNKQLYADPNEAVLRVICSLEEFDELLTDEHFSLLLRRICVNNRVHFVSVTLTIDSLQTAANKVWAQTQHLILITEVISQFPYPVTYVQALETHHLKKETQLLLGEDDFYNYPDLFFISDKSKFIYKFAIDLELQRGNGSDDPQTLLFPFGAFVNALVIREDTRINMDHEVTIYPKKIVQGIHIRIPSNYDIIKSILTTRFEGLALKHLPVKDLYLSNAGQKMDAFYKLLGSSWSHIDEVINDRFWLNIFRYSSDLQSSAIKTQKGVFSIKDLQTEINNIISLYEDQISKKIQKRIGTNGDKSIIKDAIVKFRNEVYGHFIENKVADYIHSGVLLLGMKVICPHCGSNKWYSLGELNQKLSCKGCREEVIPNIDSKVYLKINEIITNNLKSDLTISKDYFDGNYLVLKTLLHLKTGHGTQVRSFIWSSPLFFSSSLPDAKLESDIDIVAIVDGSIVLGEAKIDAKEFSKKEINNLVWIAKNLKPDYIIISSFVGNLEVVKGKLESLLAETNCKVIVYQPQPSYYQYDFLFGLFNSKIKNNDTKGISNDIEA